MKKISINPTFMLQLKDSCCKANDYSRDRDYLLLWNDEHCEEEEPLMVIDALRELVKKRYVIREVSYDRRLDIDRVRFYVYLFRFTAWLDRWQWFERMKCGCYIADDCASMPYKMREKYYSLLRFLKCRFKKTTENIYADN